MTEQFAELLCPSYFVNEVMMAGSISNLIAFTTEKLLKFLASPLADNFFLKKRKRGNLTIYLKLVSSVIK